MSTIHTHSGTGVHFGFLFCFMYLFLAVLDLHCRKGFPPAVASGGYSLAVVLSLLIAVVSLVAEQRLCGTWDSEVVAPGLQSTGLVVVVNGLSCSVACGIFPEQGLNPRLLPWMWILYTAPPGKLRPGSIFFFFFFFFSFLVF